MITPRLTDEDIDPIEANDGDGLDSIVAGDGWLPWDKDDLIDIYRVIFERLPEKEKQFLMAAASRHIVFHYSKIANFYAHSSKECQELMEKSALVIIDFNKAIIDVTLPYSVSYKINTAFYESQGIAGWEAMEATLAHIPSSHFTIADAKRGDIGNTSAQYAKTFFDILPFDAITVAPYMGEDSVAPFLAYKDKWTIVLGLTSNQGSQDFQQQKSIGRFLNERRRAQSFD